MCVLLGEGEPEGEEGYKEVWVGFCEFLDCGERGEDVHARKLIQKKDLRTCRDLHQRRSSRKHVGARR